MRGLTLRPPSEAMWSDDRGATLVLAAMLLAVMVGMAAMVVDLGQMRLVRQGLIPAADAGALAGAQDLVDQPGDHVGACATATFFAAANAPEATVDGCVVELFVDGGSIAVTVTEGLQTSFLVPEAGTADATFASSTAVWGQPTAVSGLRPIGLCYDGSAELKDLIDNPPSTITYVDLDFTRDDPALCGGQPGGNFLSVDPQGGASFNQLSEWTRSGYPEPLAVEGLSSTGCDGGMTCHERPYVLPSIEWSMWSLVSSRDYVPFPVYDYADADNVHVVGIVRARLYDFELAGPTSYWSLELKVAPGLVGGTCCGSPGLLAGNQVVAICGVDETIGAVCQEGTGP